jgi:hypothetical protein
MRKVNFLYLAFVLVAFVSCKDDYGTDNFTGDYSYTEDNVLWQTYQGDTVRTIRERIGGRMNISGYSGKITATFRPNGMPEEIHDYVVSGNSILGTYSSEITFPFGTFPIVVEEEGILEGGHLNILIRLSGIYDDGVYRGFIKGERHIDAVKR